MKYWWVPTRADDISLDFSSICICAALYLYICILFSIWSTGEGSGDENLQMTFGLHAFTAACAAAVGIKRPKSKECQDAKGKGRDQSNWQKMPAGPKIENDWKKTSKPKNWHDRWDRRSNAGDAILTIVDNVRNWRQHWRYIWYWFWQCWQNVNFTLCRLGSIFFAPFDRYRIYFSSLLSFFHARWNCCGLDPVAKMPRRRKMKPLCAQFNTPLHIVMQSCTQIYLL